MRLPRVQFTVRRLMIAVAIVALVSAIAIEVPPTVNPLMWDRGIRLGMGAYSVVVILMTSVVAIPLIAAVALALSTISRMKIEGRLPIRRSLAATALFGFGLAVILRPLPLDGMRQGHQLNSGTWVAYYHQFRLWPGKHITPCLDLIDRDGKGQIHPINVGTYIPNVDIRTNSDRTMVWVVEIPRPMARSRGVLCSLNLITGEFISTPGPFPAGISEGSGLPAP
jgi:hypothetical protein